MATRQMEVHRGGEWSSQQNYLPTRNQPVVLSYKRQRIPSHYIKRLREAISSEAHRNYFQQRYQWDDFVWSSIAWDPLYTIGRRTTKQRCFVNRTKLVHNWLNLGAQRAKFHAISSDTSQQCPYCTKEEDFTHLLTCDDPRAKKCRFEASTNLRKGLRTFSGGSTLLQLIKLWIKQPEQSPQTQAPTRALQWSVNQAIASQAKIGWQHLFRGIVSNDWGFITSDTDCTPPHMRKATANVNLICAIQTLQNYTLAIWTGRNDMLHSNAAIPISIREAQVNSEISALHQIHHTFSSSVQSYFRQPLEALLHAPFRTRQRWLILTKLVTSQQPKPSNGQSQLTAYNFSIHAPLHLESQHSDIIQESTLPILPGTPQQTQLTKFFQPSIK